MDNIKMHREKIRPIAVAALAALLAGCAPRDLTPAYHTPVPKTAAAASATTPAASIEPDTPSPEIISGPVRTIFPVRLSAGGSHSCLITEAGAIRCWGGNESGQLGNATTGKASLLVEAGEIPGGAAAVESGADHTCAIGADGKVWCWGANAKGQLGDGSAAARSVPAAVEGLVERAVMLAAGDSFTCALSETGGVKCWGWNIRGQLGDGSFEDRALPADVSGLTSGVIAIAAGAEHACALLAAGKIQCWGNGSVGQLGTGLMQISNQPVDAAGLPEGAVEIAAGGNFSCARTAGGKVMCWGRMGTSPSESDSLAAREVTGLQEESVSLKVGSDFACVLDASGGVECWGGNRLGQLGDGTGIHSRSRPAGVTGLSGAAAELTAGDSHACVLLRAGGAQCWGDNYHWQLGSRKPNSSPVPLGVDPAALHYYYSGIEAAAPPAAYPQKYPSLWNLTAGFKDLTAPGTNTYAAAVTRDSIWGLEFYLCAVDDARLARMLEKTKVSLLMDYAPLSEKAMLVFQSHYNSWSCQGWATALSQWENEKYELAVVYKTQEETSDGERNFPAGDYWQIVLLTVKEAVAGPQ
jgi:alpha-tubulin suppressor-like RCC1 family protein